MVDPKIITSVELQGAEQAASDLKKIGDVGEKAFKDLSDAAKNVRVELDLSEVQRQLVRMAQQGERAFRQLGDALQQLAEGLNLERATQQFEQAGQAAEQAFTRAGEAATTAQAQIAPVAEQVAQVGVQAQAATPPAETLFERITELAKGAAKAVGIVSLTAGGLFAAFQAVSTKLAKTASDKLNEIRQEAERIGATNRSIQSIRKIFADAGTDVNTVAGAVEGLTRRLFETQGALREVGEAGRGIIALGPAISSGFTDSLSEANQTINRLREGITSFGGNVTSSFQQISGSITRETVKIGSKTVEIVRGLSQLQGQFAESGRQSQRLAEDLGKLGISVGAFERASKGLRNAMLGAGFAQLQDPIEKAAIAARLFGANGNEVAEALEDVHRQQQKIARAKAIFTEAEFSAAERYQESLDKLSEQVEILQIKLGARFLPGKTQVTEFFTGLVTELNKFIQSLDTAEGKSGGFTKIINDVGQAANKAGQEVATGLQPLIKRLFDALKDPNLGTTIGRSITTAIEFIEQAFQGLLRAAGNVAKVLNETFGTNLTGLDVIIGGVITSLIGTFNSLGLAMAAVFGQGGKDANKFRQAVVKAFASIGIDIEAVVKAIGKFLSDAWEKLKEAFRQLDTAEGRQALADLREALLNIIGSIPFLIASIAAFIVQLERMGLLRGKVLLLGGAFAIFQGTFVAIGKIVGAVAITLAAFVSILNNLHNILTRAGLSTSAFLRFFGLLGIAIGVVVAVARPFTQLLDNLAAALGKILRGDPAGKIEAIAAPFKFLEGVVGNLIGLFLDLVELPFRLLRGLNAVLQFFGIDIPAALSRLNTAFRELTGIDIGAGIRKAIQDWQEFRKTLETQGLFAALLVPLNTFLDRALLIWRTIQARWSNSPFDPESKEAKKPFWETVLDSLLERAIKTWNDINKLFSKDPMQPAEEGDPAKKRDNLTFLERLIEHFKELNRNPIPPGVVQPMIDKLGELNTQLGATKANLEGLGGAIDFSPLTNAAQNASVQIVRAFELAERAVTAIKASMQGGGPAEQIVPAAFAEGAVDTGQVSNQLRALVSEASNAANEIVRILGSIPARVRDVFLLLGTQGEFNQLVLAALQAGEAIVAAFQGAAERTRAAFQGAGAGAQEAGVQLVNALQGAQNPIDAFGQAVREAVEIVKGIGPAAQQSAGQAATAIGNTAAVAGQIPAALAPAGPALEAIVQGASNADQVMESLNGSIVRLKDTLGTTLADISRENAKLVNVRRGVAQSSQVFTDSLAETVSKGKQLGPAFNQAGQAVTGFGSAARGAGKAVVDVARGTDEWLKATQEGFKGIQEGFKAIQEQFKLQQEKERTKQALIQLDIKREEFAIQKQIERIRLRELQIAKELATIGIKNPFARLQEQTNAAIEVFKKFFGELQKAFDETVAKMAQAGFGAKLIEEAQSAAAKILEVFTQLGQQIRQAVAGGQQAAPAAGAGDLAAATAGLAPEAAGGGLFASLVSEAQEAARSIVAAFEGIHEKIRQAITGGGAAAGDVAAATAGIAPEATAATAGGLFASIVEQAKVAAQQVVAAFQGIAQKIQQAIAGGGAAAPVPVEGAAGAAPAAAEAAAPAATVFQGLIEQAKTAVQAIVQEFAQLPARFVEIGNQIGASLAQGINQAIQGALTQTVAALIEEVSQIGPAFENSVETAISALDSLIQKLDEAIRKVRELAQAQQQGGFGGGADLGQSFATGGFTGSGARLQPAGIVHAGEFVTSQDVLRKPGVRYLLELLQRTGGDLAAALDRLPGFASGGFVGGADIGAIADAVQPAEPSGPTSVANFFLPSGRSVQLRGSPSAVKELQQYAVIESQLWGGRLPSRHT